MIKILVLMTARLVQSTVRISWRLGRWSWCKGVGYPCRFEVTDRKNVMREYTLYCGPASGRSYLAEEVTLTCAFCGTTKTRLENIQHSPDRDGLQIRIP